MAVMSFASGPATLPQPVLEDLQRDIGQWRTSGQSVLALPFTGPEFATILDEAERDIRSLLHIPANYRVLFLQGGAFAHFALLPMNIVGQAAFADYVESGLWSRRAITEAAPWVRVRMAARGRGGALPPPESWIVAEGSAYCHYTSNETADGLQYHTVPDTGPVPLVADMSADLCTRPQPIERFGLIYASAQKNLGAAGLTVVIVREDLLGRFRAGIPAPLNYTLQAEARSKVSTPPTFAIAVAARMLRWLIETGGTEAAEARSLRRSAELYAAIAEGGFYRSPIVAGDRSRVSVRFHLSTPALERMFTDEATANGLLHLGGHPSVGGIRANLYAGVPDDAVQALVAFMADFKRRRG